MTGIQTHIIRKQNLKVHTSVHDAFALKRKMELIMTEISPKLNILFDELISENDWLQIDKLDIHIDELSESELDEELQKRIIQSIREKIEALKYEASSMEVDQQKPFEIVAVHQKTISAFVYFLQNGLFPWWYEPPSHSAFENQILSALADETIANANFLSISGILQNFDAQFRLTEQFSQNIFLKIAEQLCKKLSSNLFSEIELIQITLNEIAQGQLFGFEKPLLKVIHRSNIILLQQLLKSNNYSTLTILEIWIKSFLSEIQLQTHRTNELRSYQLERLNKYLEANKISRQPGSIISETKSQFDKAFDHTNDTFSQSKKERKEGINSEFAEWEKEGLKKNSIADLLEITDGSLVANAGLVIVAPFLPELFRNLGIFENDQLTDTNQAIAIMHYIVHGNLEYREYDVLLCKVLCGLENNEPISIVNHLPENTENEVEQMLTTAISYWTALKSTSPDGLREGFLLRSGKLSHKFDEWFLLVEQKTLDVLLQQLPWTIGFIKLPWMKKMLKVEWV